MTALTQEGKLAKPRPAALKRRLRVSYRIGAKRKKVKIVELGDGQVAGLPPRADVEQFYAA